MKKYLLTDPRLLALYGITAILAALLGMSFAYVMAGLVNLISSPTWEYLYQTILVSLGWLVANILMTWCYGYLKNLYLKKIKIQLRQDLFEHIVKQKPSQFSQTSTGAYTADLNNNVENLEGSFFDPILESVYNLANLIGAFAGMLFISFNTIYLIAFMVVVSAVIPTLASKYVQKKSREFLGGQDFYQSKLKEFLSGFLVIRSFHLFAPINREHWRCNSNMESKRKEQRDLNIVMYCAAAFCGLLATILAMAFGAVLVLQGKADAGAIVAMGHLIGNITGVSDAVTRFLSQITASKPIRRRFQEILNWVPYENEGRKQLDEIKKITLENLTFRYPGKEESVDALHRISFQMEAGKAYAVVGKSGCGKSTLLNILQGYYGDYTGDILFGTESMKQFTPESIAVQIGQIQQEIFLFDDTIRNNITLYQSFPDSQINEAIQKAGLAGLLRSLPGGLDTVIAEDGGNLSGGERQRLAIARLILHNSRVFLLDEFTSSLDAPTSAEIEKNMLSLHNKIIVHATHKLTPELLEKYDEILVMNQGEIVERGSYKELIAEKGYFYGMTRMT